MKQFSLGSKGGYMGSWHTIFYRIIRRFAFWAVPFILVFSYSIISFAEDCAPEHLNVLSESNLEQISVFEHKAFKVHDNEQDTIDLFAEVIERIDVPHPLPEEYIIVDAKNNLRIDLMAIDFIDQVDLVLDKSKDEALKKELSEILDNNPVRHFSAWYKHLMNAARDDSKLMRKLNKNLVFQIYDGNGVAIAHSVGIVAPNLRMRIKRNQKILGYNNIALDPEGRGLLRGLSKKRKPFSIEKLTVSKMMNVKGKEIKQNEQSYYKRFCKRLLAQPEMKTQDYEVTCDYKRKKKVKLKVSKDASKDFKQKVKPLFEATYDSHQKLDYFKSLSSVNNSEFDPFPSPSKFNENVDAFDEKIKEETYHQLLAGDNDETVMILRKWIKKNYTDIEKKLDEYNKKHGTSLTFDIKNKKRIRRHEALEQYQTLLTLFPEAPWIEKQVFTIITPKGKQVITGKSFFGILAHHAVEYAKSYMNPETIVSYGVGTGVAFLTGGNVMAGAITKTIVRDAISGYRYDKTFEESFEDTPIKIVSSFANSAGFTPGEIPLGAFSGSVTGGIRSLLTGQDYRKGVIVGAGFGAMRTALPYDIAHPTIKLDVKEEIDNVYAAQSILLDTTTNALYHGAQGAVVAAWEKDETAVSGFSKGAGYGVAESLVLTSMFGIKYDMFGAIHEKGLEKQFRQESRYHPKVGTAGMLDRNKKTLYDEFWNASEGVPYRVAYGKWGWYTEKVLGGDASFSTPWFITSPKKHYGSAGTIAHEVSHQVQARDMGGMTFLIGYGIEAIKDGTRGSHINHEMAEDQSGNDFNRFEQYQNHGYGH